MKNKSYIGISFVVLIFGIYFVPIIVNRIKNGETVKGNSLDIVANNKKDNDLMVVGKVPNFELINQNNQKISDKSYLGKVFVVEFFFTTCPTICPKMNANMLEIQKKFFGNPNFGIASISINPENDTAEVLKSHAEILGAKSENWHFLTGDETKIMDLSYKGFNLYAGKNLKIAGGFEHSGMFALIDKKGNIRCRKDQFNNPIVYYDGLEKEGVKAIMKDITILLDE
jgi:protein SCO1/2